MFTHTVAMVAGTLPLTVLVRRSGRQDDALLLALYICVAAGFAAWLALPFIAWTPETGSLFGVVPWALN